MSQAGLESFGAYQKGRELFDTYFLNSISVSFHEPIGGSSKSQAPNPKEAPITKFQMASSPQPSPPVEGREKTTSVHGPSACEKHKEALHDRGRSRSLAQPFQGCGHSTPQSQGSSVQAGLAAFATLGFEAESLRDSGFVAVHDFSACPKQKGAPHD
jgi:hypothetical protein